MPRRQSAHQTDFSQALFGDDWPAAVREPIAAISRPAASQGNAQPIPIYTVQLVRRVEMEATSVAICAPEDAARIAATYLDDADREHLIVLLLDAKNHVMGLNTVSVGDLTSTIAHPRETYKAAVLANCASIILAHNHPSGDPTPSYDDILVTKRMQDAGEIIGIELLDHIVVGANGKFVSLKERGHIAERPTCYRGGQRYGWTP